MAYKVYKESFGITTLATEGDVDPGLEPQARHQNKI